MRQHGVQKETCHVFLFNTQHNLALSYTFTTRLLAIWEEGLLTLC